MNLNGKWRGKPVLKGDPFISGLKENSQQKVTQATRFVEQYLGIGDDDLSEDDLVEALPEIDNEQSESQPYPLSLPGANDGPSPPKRHRGEEVSDSGNFYFCFHCRFVSYKLEELQEHILVRHLRRKQKRKAYVGEGCPMCDYVPTLRANLVRHMKEVHGEGTRNIEYKCTKCSLVFKRQCDLRNHTATKHENKFFNCTVCDYRTDRKSRLKNHLYKKHSVGSPLQTLPKEKSQRPENSQRTRYKCSFCNFTSLHTTHIRTHVMRKHTKEKPFRCKFCGHRTTTAYDLKSHLRSHTNERPFACEECPYRALKSTHLKDHINRKHRSLPKKHKCPYCPYSSNTAWCIKSHLKFKHKDEIKSGHRCIYCSYLSSTTEELKQHMVTEHSDEDLFMCPDCDYCGKTLVCLKKHVTSKHCEANQSFPCTYCEYTCSREETVRRHVKRKHPGKCYIPPQVSSESSAPPSPCPSSSSSSSTSTTSESSAVEDDNTENKEGTVEDNRINEVNRNDVCCKSKEGDKIDGQEGSNSYSNHVHGEEVNVRNDVHSEINSRCKDNNIECTGTHINDNKVDDKAGSESESEEDDSDSEEDDSSESDSEQKSSTSSSSESDNEQDNAKSEVGGTLNENNCSHVEHKIVSGANEDSGSSNSDSGSHSDVENVNNSSVEVTKSTIAPEAVSNCQINKEESSSDEEDSSSETSSGEHQDDSSDSSSDSDDSGSDSEDSKSEHEGNSCGNHNSRVQPYLQPSDVSFNGVSELHLSESSTSSSDDDDKAHDGS